MWQEYDNFWSRKIFVLAFLVFSSVLLSREQGAAAAENTRYGLSECHAFHLYQFATMYDIQTVGMHLGMLHFAEVWAHNSHRPCLEVRMFAAPPAFWLKCSVTTGNFGKKTFTASLFPSFLSRQLPNPMGVWSSELGDLQRGNVGAGQDTLNRASKNTCVIRLQVQWVKISQAWVWSRYFQCNSWDSSLLKPIELPWSLLQTGGVQGSAPWSIWNATSRS